MDWVRGTIIGRGSSGTVSVATSCRSGNIFAVKSAEVSQSELLQREQKFLSTLTSPHVISYKGQNVTTENNMLMYNLMMEYAAAGTITDAIQKEGGRLMESMISQYTCQIVQGLEYLHSSNIVHCDIKCQNILITDNGAKIADFGCAKWTNSAMPIAGTPMFMAPEVARGEEQGCPADIWALGCTIIEMATGGSPWPNDNNNALSILYKIAFSGELPNIPIFMSTQAKDFLNKCLHTNNSLRWTAKQLMRHPFIKESNLMQPQSLKNSTSSPTSVLDQVVWTFMEESETIDDTVKTSSSSSSRRIKQLSLHSRVPSWTWEETWITIRTLVEDVKHAR